MAGCGQQIDVIGAVLGVFPAVDSRKIGLEKRFHDIIGIIVVISVPGGSVHEHQPGSFMAGKIIRQRCQKRCHGKVFPVKHMVADGRHHIGQGAQTHALNIGGVISGAAVMVIRSGCNAVIDQQRQKRRRHIPGIEALDDIVAPDLDVDKMMHLPDKGI